MKITRPETTTYWVVDKVVCNNCGREFAVKDGHCCLDTVNSHESMEVHDYKANCGYFSKIGDMMAIEFDLCDDCMIALMKHFKIPPTVASVMDAVPIDNQSQDNSLQNDFEAWLTTEAI